jgi:hypothetical protein
VPAHLIKKYDEEEFEKKGQTGVPLTA